MGQFKLITMGGVYIDINSPNFPINKQGLSLDSEVVGDGYQVEPGGSAVNFAKTSSSLGLKTVFMGKVGQDSFGELMPGLLKNYGIEAKLIKSKNESTNVSFNMINSGGKSIMAVVGTANKSIEPSEIIELIDKTIDKHTIFYMGGCLKLKKLIPAYSQIASLAHSKGSKTVLDHGRITNDITKQDKEAIKKLALVVDYYLPSYDEFMDLWGLDDLEEGLLKINSKFRGVVVVKNGEKGAIFIKNGVICTIPAYKVKTIHTIGAGDSFNAGLISSQVHGDAIEQSIIFGCASAGLKISQPNLPSSQQVARFIENNYS